MMDTWEMYPRPGEGHSAAGPHGGRQSSEKERERERDHPPVRGYLALPLASACMQGWHRVGNGKAVSCCCAVCRVLWFSRVVVSSPMYTGSMGWKSRGQGHRRERQGRAGQGWTGLGWAT